MQPCGRKLLFCGVGLQNGRIALERESIKPQNGIRAVSLGTNALFKRTRTPAELLLCRVGAPACSAALRLQSSHLLGHGLYGLLCRVCTQGRRLRAQGCRISPVYGRDVRLSGESKPLCERLCPRFCCVPRGKQRIPAPDGHLELGLEHGGQCVRRLDRRISFSLQTCALPFRSLGCLDCRVSLILRTDASLLQTEKPLFIHLSFLHVKTRSWACSAYGTGRSCRTSWLCKGNNAVRCSCGNGALWRKSWLCACSNINSARA